MAVVAEYGGFWRRVLAYVLDTIIITVVGAVVGGILGAVYGTMAMRSGSGFEQVARNAEHAGNVLGLILGWLYSAVMESGTSQATFGKQALGLQVVDLDGGRIGFGRATGRHFVKIVSGLLLLVGFLMVGWTARKQGLHDKMAGTLVIKKGTMGAANVF